MIELQHVTKRYGSVEAVKDLSFSVPQGQIVGLLGQNGAGKTTTLNMLTGYCPPTEGTVTVDGLDMLTQARACKRRIGYLPEQPPLYPEMTIREYLSFVCRLREVRGSKIRSHVSDIMQRCGIEGMDDKLVGSLSKGYRQRVGFAQALCGDPPVIVLDEPTVGLDPRQVVEIRELMAQLGRDHTVIFSSHILSEIQQLCSRVVILHKGKLVKEADMQELNGENGGMCLRASIACGEERLMPALRGLPCIRKAKVLPRKEKGITEVELRFAGNPDGDPRRQLFNLLCGMDAPIYMLMPVRETLEELFLRATDEG
ncbi:MAG: ABC transporter ATP-binding protein [Clostridia bacterium]|nr:ABC transporter ATP-binding protein [Clostridia bacterium]